MSENKICAIRAGGIITGANLIELGSDPDLEGYAVVCKWKEDGYTTGWSNMDDRDLAYASLILDREMKNDLFGKSE